jgi:polar amino acid transport system substrate-binding protein
MADGADGLTITALLIAAARRLAGTVPSATAASAMSVAPASSRRCWTRPPRRRGVRGQPCAHRLVPAARWRGRRLAAALVAAMVLLLLLGAPAAAKDYRLSVAQLPLYSETPAHGLLIDVLEALDDHYQQGRFLIEVYPFQRSIDNVIHGRADFHFPTIGPTIWGREEDGYERAIARAGIRRSSCSLTKTHFALFTNAERPRLDVDALDDQVIETERGHTMFFEQDVRGTTCLPCSVKKLGAGRIDGLIFAAREIDFFIAEAGITNIRRQPFKVFGSKFILPLGPKGDAIDRLLCRLIAEMVRDGSLARAAAPYAAYFEREFGAPYLPRPGDIEPVADQAP